MKRALSRKRAVFIGIVTGIAWLAYNASGCFIGFVFLLLQPIILGISGVVGGWHWLLRFRNENAIPQKRSWNGALIGWLAFMLTCFFVTKESRWVYFDASSLALSIFYVGAKLGCAELGCCNWNNAADLPKAITRIRLQYLEAGLTIISCIGSLVIAYLVMLPGILSACLLSSHFIIRVLFASHRHSPQAIWPNHDRICSGK